MDDLRPLELLRLFTEAGVEFIVVGGVAGVLLGSPLNTDDLDLVYAKNEENYERILPILEDLDAIFRGTLDKVFRPTRRDLELNRVNLFKTRLGKLDLLPTIGDGWTYSDLLPRSKLIEIDDFSVRILRVDALIEAKAIADRPQDRAAIVFLRELMDRSDSRASDADGSPQTRAADHSHD